MVDKLLPEILRVQPDGPYLMIGYSFGGLLAYGLAGRLRALGHEVQLAGLIDILTPAEWAREATWRSRAHHAVRGGIGRTTGEAVQLARNRAHKRLLTLRPRSEHLVVAPSEFPDAGVAVMLGTRYRPVGHDARLVVIVARSRLRRAWPRIPQQSRLQPAAGWRPSRRFDESARQRESSLGWSEVHCEPVHVVVVPGDHQSILAPPNIGPLGRALAEAIRSSESAVPARLATDAAITN
jgi:thioesterase domain-containing protein